VTQKDLANAEVQIEKWKATRQLHSNEIKELKREIAALEAQDQYQPRSNGAALDSIDYMGQDFEWSKQLKSKLKKVFGIDDFRLCQKGYAARVGYALRSQRFTLRPVAFVMQILTKGTSSASCQQEEGRA